jgi:hypothetical protein
MEMGQRIGKQRELDAKRCHQRKCETRKEIELKWMPTCKLRKFLGHCYHAEQ